MLLLPLVVLLVIVCRDCLMTAIRTLWLLLLMVVVMVLMMMSRMVIVIELNLVLLVIRELLLLRHHRLHCVVAVNVGCLILVLVELD